MLDKEIHIAREHGYPGVVLFAYQALKERGWFEKLKQGVFKEPALPRPPPGGESEKVSIKR